MKQGCRNYYGLHRHGQPVLVCCHVFVVPYLLQSHERVSIGRAPYKLSKEGGGQSIKCFCIIPQKSVYVGFQRLNALQSATIVKLTLT